MLKKFLSIALIAAILATLFQFTLPLTWYVSNYHHIITELCVNRFNPDVDCDGMCQLEKKVDKEQDQHSEASGNRLDRRYRIDFFFSQEQLLSPPTAPSSQKKFSSDPDLRPLWISEPPCPPPRYG